MFEPVGSDLATSMAACFESVPNPSTDDFTIVADLLADGSPADVELRPETNVAACVGRDFIHFHFAPAPAYPGRRGFPIVLELHIHDQPPPDSMQDGAGRT